VRAEYSSVLVRAPYVLTPCCAAAALRRRGEVDASGSVSGGVVSVEGPAVVRAGSNRWVLGAAAALAVGVWIECGNLPWNGRRLAAVRGKVRWLAKGLG
jgi:hypothetical protein